MVPTFYALLLELPCGLFRKIQNLYLIFKLNKLKNAHQIVNKFPLRLACAPHCACGGVPVACGGRSCVWV